MKKEQCCSHKTKERSQEEYKNLLNRLNRIEGQIRGIKNMVEKDAYCTDILVQVAAANAALNSFSKVLLANHMRTCVVDDIRAGKDGTIDELVATIQKLMRLYGNPAGQRHPVREEGEETYGTIYSNRHELRSLQRPCGKGGIQGAGGHILFRQPADKLHGSGRDRVPSGHCKGGCGCRIRGCC